MYKLKIFSISKTKEPWLIQSIEEYSRRFKPILSIEWIFAKDNPHLISSLSKEPSYIALDPNGKDFTSEEFSSWFIKQLQTEFSRLSLVIGGAEGLPSAILKGATAKISLSKLTFTHQLARLILIEQIYRALEIDKGSQYHK